MQNVFTENFSGVQDHLNNLVDEIERRRIEAEERKKKEEEEAAQKDINLYLTTKNSEICLVLCVYSVTIKLKIC